MSKPIPTSSIQVIDRLTALMDAIAAQPAPASLKILAAETGLHTSTAFRILAALQTHGLVDRNDSGNYRLGPKLMRYGEQARVETDIRQLAQPVMARLRDQVGETVNLTVREGDQVVYIERALPNRMMRVEQVIGSRAPLHVTAVGKLMLGEGGEDECRSYAARTGLPAYTKNTITDAHRLINETCQAVADGLAHDHEEAELGVACIGVLIHDASGHAVAGLSISAPRERHQAHWIELLKEAGQKLSAKLGYAA